MAGLHRTQGLLLALLVFALFAVVPATWRGAAIRVALLAVVIGCATLLWNP